MEKFKNRIQPSLKYVAYVSEQYTTFKGKQSKWFWLKLTVSPVSNDHFAVMAFYGSQRYPLSVQVGIIILTTYYFHLRLLCKFDLCISLSGKHFQNLTRLNTENDIIFLFWSEEWFEHWNLCIEGHKITSPS